MPGGPPTSARPVELRMDPRDLPGTPYQMQRTEGGSTTPPAAIHLIQVDVSTQVDLHDGASLQRGVTPLYSREDIKEQYCITNRQLDAVEKSSSSIFGCLTSRGPSPCSSSAKASILSACVRSAPSDENLFDAPYPYPHQIRPSRQASSLRIMYQQPYSNYHRHLSQYHDYGSYPGDDEDNWIRRRPKSCTVSDPKRYTWLPEDEESTKLEGPRSVLPTSVQHLSSTVHPQQHKLPQVSKPKHVSFARSHTLTSFDVPHTKSPTRAHNQERLIDSQPTMHNSLATALGMVHPYPQPEPRIFVLEKQPKRGTMKAQATQTESGPGVRGRIAPVTLSPRTIHRVKMVSQGAQTNGLPNGRKLTKSYSEAGHLSTPLGIGSTVKDDSSEHEPLQRTQSEEPPRSPFMVNTPPRSPISREEFSNGNLHSDKQRLNIDKKKEWEFDDEEILIDFKPAPVSPDARALLNEMAQPYRRYITLQKTLSDGEIQIERRELIGETGEPSYPHTCRRNHQDPWNRKLHAPVQFSSTPQDLSLLRVTSSPDDHNDEEFHENFVHRGLFRKRSVSLEDGVQVLSTNEYVLPRSLPTSPTSPTSVTVPSKARRSQRNLMAIATGMQRQFLRAMHSPFVSSDSLANDVTRDHSDGIWNESQATVLQVDSLALLTPSSKRRHLLVLQHQQRSSMDTDALDAEDEMDVHPSSPRIRLETATPIILTSNQDTTFSNTNGRPKIGFLRRSPGLPLSQPQSQSSSEFGLSRSGTTDISETSTTDDYVTANASTGTGTTPGTSTTTSSLSKSPYLPTSLSGPTSTTATTADGSSFESASSIYSLARSEVVLEDPNSPHKLKNKLDSLHNIQEPSSPLRSTSSSSSGSYDLEEAMPENVQETYNSSFHCTQKSGKEQEIDEVHRSSSGVYAESPTDVHLESEKGHSRWKKSFTVDFPSNLELPKSPSEPDQVSNSQLPITDETVFIPSSNHRDRHRSRTKSVSTRSPHRNNKRRSFGLSESLVQPTTTAATTIQQQLNRSSQNESWREQLDDAGHVQTSDDSSCSHHYHMHHHYQHHHIHREVGESTTGRHKRIRDSPRKKSSSHISVRRRSNEDKNAALTGSLPRRRSRPVDYMSSSRLSPAGSGQHNQSPNHNGRSTIIMKSSNHEVRLKALSTESLRSISPGSDNVFYNIEDGYLDQLHCHHCGREVPEEIVQPPAGFADSPEGGHKQASKNTSGQRLFKKFDKRYRSEDRNDRRHHRSSIGRSDVRAKSEERGVKSTSRYGEEFNKKRLHARSTDASMEILTGGEDENAYIEPYTSGEWIYIGEFEESHVWKRPDSKDGDDESECYKERRGSQESTESERNFRKKYQAATHRMIHRKSSGEMYKRIQTKCFESDKRVVVKRDPGGEFGFRIHGSKPVVVSAIEPDTPAESSGLEVGDIVMSVNGKSVMEATHSEVVRLAHSGSDILELEVARTCNVLAPQMGKDGSQDVKQEPAVCSGYLWRKARSDMSSSSSALQDKWVRRWFALRTNNCLYYYKTDTDLQPVGAVMLLKYDVEITHESRPHSFCIKKHGAPSMHLAADTDEAACRWSSIIKEAVERNNKADTWLDTSLRLQQLPACMIQRPDCFGYLSKQHQRIRRTSSPASWSRRYCVLKDAALYFYDDANAERAFGVACLHGFKVHGSAPNSGGRKHAFEVQPPDPTQRIYTFATDSEMDKKRWLAALEYSIDRWIKIG